MADIQEAIRRLRYIFSTEGADKVVSDQAKVEAAVTTSSSTQEKASLSLDKSFANLERRYVSTVKNSQDYAKVQTTVNAAVAQNPALQERANAVLAAAAEKYGQAGVASRAFAAATSGVSGQLIALSSGAGPVGVFLAALGPWGIAAAVGLTAVSAAFNAALEKAHALAEEATQLQRFSETTGLATDQLQALTQAAAKHGVQAEETIGAIQKFTAAFEELRNGSGTMLDQIRKIDPVLADQMQRTTDSASAFDLLSKAIHKADDEGNIFARNALARAAGGRGGIASLVGVAGAINDAGSIAGLTAAASVQGGIVDPQLLDRLHKLQAEIDETKKRTDNLTASLFSEAVLQKQLQFAQAMERAAKAIKDMADQESHMGWFEFIVTKLAQAGVNGAGVDVSPTSIPVNAPAYGSTPVTMAAPSGAGGLTPSALASQWKEYVSALGSAASATDRLHARQADLFAQYKDGKITLDVYNKALTGAGIDYQTTAISARVSALGMMATATDVATQAQLRINKANLDGAGVSPVQAKLLVEASQIQLSGTKLNAAATYGLAGQQDLLNQKNAEYLNRAKQLGLSNEQIAKGYDAVARSAKSAYEASQVAASAHPQLTQMGFDYANLDKQFDALSTGSLNQLTTSLADMTTGAKNAGQAFTDMSNYIVRALEEMVIKMTIVAPLAKSLEASLGGGGGLLGFLGIGGGSGSATATTASMPSAAGADAAFSAHGNAFYGGNVIPFARGGVVSHPTLFAMANGAGLMGEAGPEAVMPLRRTSAGDLGVVAQGGGGNVVNNINVTNTASGTQASVTSQKKNSTGGFDLDVLLTQMEGEMGKRVVDGRSALGHSVASTYGLRRRAQ